MVFIKNKSESFKKFKEFKAQVENQTRKSIKTLRSNRGGEYLSTEFIEFLREHGIVSQLTPPGTPQLNVLRNHAMQQSAAEACAQHG